MLFGLNKFMNRKVVQYTYYHDLLIPTVYHTPYLHYTYNTLYSILIKMNAIMKNSIQQKIQIWQSSFIYSSRLFPDLILSIILCSNRKYLCKAQHGSVYAGVLMDIP